MFMFQTPTKETNAEICSRSPGSFENPTPRFGSEKPSEKHQTKKLFGSQAVRLLLAV